MIRGLTACVSLLGGRFVYVDVIQNAVQFVTAEVKLKELLNDKAANDDGLNELQVLKVDLYVSVSS